MSSHFESIEQVVAELAQGHYVADRSLATVLFLAHKLEKPIFQKSIDALQKLNSMGYGRLETGFLPDLVCNPVGAFLPEGAPSVLSSQAEGKKKDADTSVDFVWISCLSPISYHAIPGLICSFRKVLARPR